MTAHGSVNELSAELLAFAEGCVERGEYANVAEVLNAGVRLLQLRSERLKEVRRELGAVLEAMDAGEYIEPTDDELLDAVHERALKHVSE